jgi:hypothetical protein
MVQTRKTNTQNIEFVLVEEPEPALTSEEIIAAVADVEADTEAEFMVTADIGENVICDDEFVAKQLDYSENYKVSDLKRIAEYYEIETRKLKKAELVEAIVVFESVIDNMEVVFERMKLWDYIYELKCDKYLKQFILF